MNFQIVLLESAERDLKELKAYINKQFGIIAWQTSYQKIQESVQMIQTFPQSGKIPEELEQLNLSQYRQVISGMNRIIYEIRQQTIYIHIICDTRKDMTTLLTQRLLRGF